MTERMRAERLRAFLEDECGGSLCDNTWGCIHVVVRDEIDALKEENEKLTRFLHNGVRFEEVTGNG